MSQLQVEARNEVGKGVARKLRAVGRIPAVCYGAGKEPRPVSVDPRALEKALGGDLNTLVDLQIEGGGAYDGGTVLVRDFQRDPVNGAPLHADLFEIDMTHKIAVQVPIHIHGVAKGVDLDGGILDHALREIELLCMPRSIPNELVADVTELGLGESLHVRDLPLPEGVELHVDGDLSVVSVVAPRVEKEVEAAAPEGDEAAEDGDKKEEASSDDAKAEEKSGD